MSSGSFVVTKYAAAYGSGTNIHPIRVQPETLALSITIGGSAVANTAPAGALTSPISARVSSGKRTLGLNAFTVGIKFSGPTPTGYSANQRINLPCLNSAIRAATKGATGTYLGASIVVVGTSPERAQ